MKTCTIAAALVAATCLGCNHNAATIATPEETALTAVSHVDEAPDCCCSKEDEAVASCCSADAINLSEPLAVSNLNVPDVELLNEKGRKVQFYTDLVKDKVVAISFFFTRCPTICPRWPISAGSSPRSTTRWRR